MIEKLLNRLTVLSVAHPRSVIAVTVVVTLAFASRMPRIKVDTDPKHMLPSTSPVRLYNDQVEKDFALHPDVIVLGIVNEDGIVNPRTLDRIADLTGRIQAMPGVITRDVVSLTTIDNITARGGDLTVRPAVEAVPTSREDLQALRNTLLANPLLVNRIISPDATTTAIYVPIEATANGKEIATAIRTLLPRDPGDDQFYLAGDPIARDTFGSEMFRQMGLFAPIAALLMCIALWFMFHNVLFIVANMAVAMVSITWCMGLLIGLGIPVHIMSSMSPVFLMAIATDSVHILNEFVFRSRDVGDRRRAVLETMAGVARPVFYSDLTTAVGFAALASATIVPVKVFGLLVGFGTLVILLMSFTLVPAILMLMGPDRVDALCGRARDVPQITGSRLFRLGTFCVDHAKPIALVGAALLVLAGVGMARLHVNNNMVDWFKHRSEVRTSDRVLNARLGGTATGYLVVETPEEDGLKDPAMLEVIDGLQRELEKDPRVGKTFSVVDYVKRINRVLHGDDPAAERIPSSAEEVGQYLFLFSASAKPTDLDNVVDYAFRRANLVLQLKSWDAGVMRDVITRAETHLRSLDSPGTVVLRPAGISYFNLVWSDEVLWGMLQSFFAGIVLVFVLLVAQTRSLIWGSLSFAPLLFTIAVIYGAVGFGGKDFDMPVAVLSTLSLGLAVDFAIHFVARFQRRRLEEPDLRQALAWTVARPGKGIILNALLFALGFAVMVFAALTPYITVGILMAAIMLLSAITSVVCLPALIRLCSRFLRQGGTG